MDIEVQLEKFLSHPGQISHHGESMKIGDLIGFPALGAS